MSSSVETAPSRGKIENDPTGGFSQLEMSAANTTLI